MPYPSEHACRVAEPLPHNSGVFARKSIAPGISVILQKSKGDTGSPMKIQSYRFGKHQFTTEEAKVWLKKHNIDYISFEPASTPEKQENRADVINRITKELSGAIVEARGDGVGVGGDKQGDGGTDVCICPKCKEEIKHNRGIPCNEVKCPKCGTPMVGKPESKKEAILYITKELSKAIF